MMGMKERTLIPGLTIRPFPFPYRAMLAICSDLDETPDRRVYLETMRFLNTREETAMGRGVGLEVGNTIYFDMPPNQFSYWNTDVTGRAMVRDLILSGHIDCLHSYGDLATTRGQAGRALDELECHGCRIEAWVDHGTANTNFDGDIMKGSGDVPGSPAYHADLTRSFGVEYVWRGRVTSIIGQNVPRNLNGIWRPDHLVGSGKTVLKEFVKGALSWGGDGKYAMHGRNRALRRTALRDGQQVYEFMRCNPHWEGVSSHETASGIAEVLTPMFLEHLLARQALCILYTHLGKIANREEIFPRRSRESFFLLDAYASDGRILVTTTRRLLGYCRMLEEAVFTVKADNDGCALVEISYTGPNRDLDGLTLQSTLAKQLSVKVNGQRISLLKSYPPDSSGIECVSLPWPRLEFPRV